MVAETERTINRFGNAVVFRGDDERVDLLFGKSAFDYLIQKSRADPFAPIGGNGRDTLKAGDFFYPVKEDAHIANKFIVQKSPPVVAVAIFLLAAVIVHLVGDEDPVVFNGNLYRALGDLLFNGGLPIRVS
ncbi:MAG: hypothetical protein ABF380_05060, partial [Akkermansiaceae bacterium]